MEIKKFEFGDFILGIPSDIGPRIIHFSLKKYPEKNIFGILPDIKIETEDGIWHIYGGHRLWTSPEDKPRSYSLDDNPVRIEILNKQQIKIIGNPECKNLVQKEIDIELKEKKIEVNHKIRNIGRWPIKFACWCLSVMKKGGFAIIPLKPKKVDKFGLLPDRHISFWQYSDLKDKRLIWGNEYIFIKQDENCEKPFKIGTMVNPEFTCYFVDGLLFIKKIECKKGEYPDFGCNVEVYTNSEFLELETLSPLEIVEPGDFIEHKEIWDLKEVGEIPSIEEENIKKILENYLPLG